MLYKIFSGRSVTRACGILIVTFSTAMANADTIDDTADVNAVGMTMPLAAAIGAGQQIGSSLAGVALDAPGMPVNAEVAAAPASATEAVPATPSVSPSIPGDPVIDGLGIALETGLLDDQRGGFDLGPAQPLSGILTTGVVGDNRAVDVATGSNAIRDGAFSNTSGIPVVIQNTGANVLIQNATIVNLQLH